MFFKIAINYRKFQGSVLLPLRTYSVPAMYPRVFEVLFLVSLSLWKEFVLYVVCSSWKSRVAGVGFDAASGKKRVKFKVQFEVTG